jgi:hypothetical protein
MTTDCELLEGCLFFNDKLKNLPKASDMMKKMYCKWHYAKCARYKIAIAMGKSAVPKDLFPGDHNRSSEILIQYDMK